MTRANSLPPLQTLLELRRGQALPMPPRLARLYGDLRMPHARRAKAHVFSNFVSSIDGVVSLNVRGHEGGGDISGFSIQDRMVMGLLRAIADVVIVGAGTLAADPQHVWTPEAICPELADEYRRLQTAIDKRQPALNVVVSAGGGLDLRLPVFAAGRVPILVVTTRGGARRLRRQAAHSSLEIAALPGGRRIAPDAILEAVVRHASGRSASGPRASGPRASSLRASGRSASGPRASGPRASGRRASGPRILVEGGPQLLGCFYEERLLDEQFLTLAPQLAGRKAEDGRPGLVMGTTFAPRDPMWGNLIDARRGRDHLFLRYSFTRPSRR
jgi:riboflavin biosynthesis pyrimidine reductase